MARKIRTAVSVFFGGLTLLLVAMWVRSYWNCDIVTFGISPGPGYMFGSSNGELSAARFRSIDGAVSTGWHAWTITRPVERAWYNARYNELLGIRYGSFFVAIPYCYITTFAMVLAAAPWGRWRFSLRTLLLATTLLAVVLGLAAWAAR